MSYTWDDQSLPRHRRHGIRSGRIGSPSRKQPRKKRGRVPPLAKPCIVKFKGNLACGWNSEKKILVIGADSQKIFSSRTKALRARWHTIQNFNNSGLTQPNGVPFHSDDFVVVDV